jgi:C_GCAxxG_C_C family probable redox protein
MNSDKAAVDLFRGGCACSQAVLGAFGPRYGLDETKALRLASGFAGGMRTADTCGAVTGAFMVLGLALADDACRTADGRQVVFAAMATFREKFAAAHGALDCRELLGCNISTPEGLDMAKAKDVFATTCVELVRDAATILDEMLT